MKAYLIGNGASIAYGSPLGSDIFKRAFELFYERLEKGPHDNCFYRLKVDIPEIIGTMDDLRKLLAWGDLSWIHMGEYRRKFEYLRNRNISYSERSNFYREIKDYFAEYKIWELFLKIIEYYKDNDPYGFGELPRKKFALLDGQGNFFDKIANFSFKTIYFAIKDSNCDPGYYTNFAKAVSNSLEDTLIINLNYDNLLEKALKDNFKGIVEFSFGDKIQCFPSSQSGENTGKKILLFKPHGSFGFLFCDKCKSITISQDVPLEYSLYRTGKRQCRNSNCGIRNLHNNFFIPYTDVTLRAIRYRDILNSIIQKMKQILDSVDEITVIGYSFSEHDGRLIDKHLKFIFENRKVIVVTKDISENEEICNRLRRFDIKAENSRLNGFADFIRHMWET